MSTGLQGILEKEYNQKGLLNVDENVDQVFV